MRARVVIMAAMLAACSRSESVSRTALPLEAYCTATVTGHGEVEVETDYLPRVISCENGGADFEALRAQAIAARSYLYYRLDRTGDIDDGTGDQVYGCGREPGIEHYMAAEATAGQVLQYQGTQVAAFYVAGAFQDPPECTGGTEDPTGTEQYVTYNSGLSGDEIEQTTLGLVNPGNRANRGCMSQNGSHCLAEAGWLAEEIIPFYYGEDIEVVQAEGACVDAPAMPDAGSGGGDAGRGGGGANDDVAGGCRVAGGGPGGLALLLLSAMLASRRRQRGRGRARAGAR